MKQSEIFLAGEGQAWLDRNKDKLGKSDPVMDAMAAAKITHGSVLEIGAANGWRVKKLGEAGFSPLGIDPGGPHIVGDYLVMDLAADNLHGLMGKFDVVIYGFCLYLCDREDLFKIAAEGDRVLQDGGHIIIHDFYPNKPYSRRYRHRDGLLSFKMKYEDLWLANPMYSLFSRAIIGDGDDRTCVSILKKGSADAAYPLDLS